MKVEKKKKWYQSISNWVVIVACAILIPIIVTNLSIMLQAKKNSDKVPSVFGIKPFMVLSGSMESEIKKGDLIITKKVNPDNLVIGDVIAFRDAAGTVTTHRIIDIVDRDGKPYFITKGDNNSTQDRNLVSLSDVEGVYLFRIPGIGSMLKSLSQPTTIIILVLIITFIFAIGFVISNKKYADIEREEYLEYKRKKELEMRNKVQNNNPNRNQTNNFNRNPNLEQRRVNPNSNIKRNNLNENRNHPQKRRVLVDKNGRRFIVLDNGERRYLKNNGNRNYQNNRQNVNNHRQIKKNNYNNRSNNTENR